MKIKFIDYYAIASNLVMGTFIIGIINIFVRGLNDLEDLIIATLILALRYFSVILIKRRFNFSKYLLIILVVRNIYRLFHIEATTGSDTLSIWLISLQIVMTTLALFLITASPLRLALKKKITS